MKHRRLERISIYFYLGIMLIDFIIFSDKYFGDNSIALDVIFGMPEVVLLFILAVTGCGSLFGVLNTLYNTIGNEFFIELEHYEWHWGNSAAYYQRRINAIQFFYSKEGKAEQLVQQKRIKDLLDRKDYLIKKKNLFDDAVTCFWGIFISGSFLSSEPTRDLGAWTEDKFWLLIVALLFIAFKQKARGQGGSYLYLLHEYEISRIDELLHRVAEQYKPNEVDGYYFKGQQIILDALSALWAKTHLYSKRAKELEQCIYTVETMNIEEGRKFLEDGNMYPELGEKIFSYINENKLLKQRFVRNLTKNEYAIMYGIAKDCKLLHLFGMKDIEDTNKGEKSAMTSRETKKKAARCRNIKSSLIRVGIYSLYYVLLSFFGKSLMSNLLKIDLEVSKTVIVLSVVLGVVALILTVLNLYDDMAKDKILYSEPDIMPELQNLHIEQYEETLRKIGVEKLFEIYSESYERERKKIDISNKTIIGGILTICLPVYLSDLVKNYSMDVTSAAFLFLGPILFELILATITSIQNDTISNTKCIERHFQDKFICKILSESWGVELDRI